MSYILDALQKSSAETEPPPAPDAVIGTAPATTPAPAGLALPWKLAIGAVLLANLGLVFLWQTDRAASSPSQPPAPAGPSPDPTYTGIGNQAALANSARAIAQPSATTAKKPLPGIVAPRESPPAQTAANTSSGARTFAPSGRAITIAEPAAGYGSAPVLPSRAAAPQPPAPRTSARETSAQPDRPRPVRASALSQLSDSARRALYGLSFSFHIFAASAEDRAVGVNGNRLTEGQSVTTAAGDDFTVEEITDDGVIMRFQHDGTTQRVAIPVMEDWKDA